MAEPSPSDDRVEDGSESPPSGSLATDLDEDDPDDALSGETIVGDPVDAHVDASSHVVVVGYDAWTDPVLAELAARDVSVAVVATGDSAVERLADRDVVVVTADDVDEACFREAGIERAEAVLVATLDDQRNVLAVLTVMNVDDSMRVVTFAGEQQDVPKLRAAGADRVVSLGQAVGDLLVEVALSERGVSEVVRELVGSDA